MFVHGISLSAWTPAAGRKSPCSWCRTSGAGLTAPPAQAMASPAWAFRVTWIPRARTQKSWHSGSRAVGRPLDSELELSLWPSVLAALPSAMRIPDTSLLKPYSTPLQNKIKLSASLRAGSSSTQNLCRSRRGNFEIKECY